MRRGLAWRQASLFLSALLALLAFLPACVSVTPESPDRLTATVTPPEPIPEYLWPPRLALEFPLTSPAVGQTESEWIDRPVTFWIPRDDWHAWLATMGAGGAMKRLGVWGRGHLSEVIVPPGPDRYANITWSRMFMFFTSAEYADLPYASRVKTPKKGGPAARPLESTLTVMRFFEPHRPPKGLIVHLTGIRGVDQELYIASTFTSRGWAVLSIPPPSKALEKHNVKRWVGSGPLDRGADLGGAADRLARLTDWVLAEWAYAAEAAVSYLIHSRPDLDGKPRALFGSSMGALALPAVAARTPGAYSAAVMVAGGGSLLRVIHESDATASDFDLRWTDAGLTNQEWETLDALTQQRSRLDPLVAARFLGGVPVLLIHATLDGIVPSGAGDRLYEALGHPERWSYPLGHIAIFAIFPLQIEIVADWLESKIFPS